MTRFVVVLLFFLSGIQFCREQPGGQFDEALAAGWRKGKDQNLVYTWKPDVLREFFGSREILFKGPQACE